MAVEKINSELTYYQLLAGETERSYMNSYNISRNIRVAIPAAIVSVDYKTMTCTCQPLIRENIQDENGVTKAIDLPILLDVPIMYPGSSTFQLTFPLNKGDEGLVIFSDMCIDAWWQSGGIQSQADSRRHDLSDGMFLPTPMSQVKKHTNYSSTNAILRMKTSSGNVIVDGVNISTFKEDYEHIKEDYGNRIAALEQQINNLTSQISSLDARVTALEGQL